MVKETFLEINLSALEKNYRFLRTKLSSKTMLLAVVKAFAYGNDSIFIAKFLEDLGVDYFAVAYISEGVKLRKSGIKKPILVLHPQIVNFDRAIEHKLEPSLYSERTLNAFIKTASLNNLSMYPVHVKFNTGLNRLGFEAGRSKSIALQLEKENSICVKSVFSHMAASEDLNENAFTLKQIDLFSNTFESFIKHYRKTTPFRHLCNTSGLINFPQAEFEMVRCGIGLYGFDNMSQKSCGLVPIMSLKTLISQIHNIKKGESVGYNRGFIAKKPTKIATLPIGHADGIGRYYGNSQGYVYVNNQKALIVGNVCMDMIMVDVTGINCKEGDSVIVFDCFNSAEKLAESCGTISYELISAISRRIKRRFV